MPIVSPSINRRNLMAGLGALAVGKGAAVSARNPTAPNIVLIVADDLGWGDLGCMGSPFLRTPNIDRLAREGVRMTDFYASANVCTPSRAGMITGRYPIRSGLAHEVITVKDVRGLPLSEVTLSEMLKPRFDTMLAGKWHLGHVAPSWPPMAHGFERFAGIPYSNDMRPLNFYRSRRDGSLAQEPAVQEALTAQIFDAGIEFVREARDRPFFLMLTPSAPHVPLRPSTSFKGRSEGATYGDVVEELDAAVGRLMAALESAGRARDTLVLFTSDNGPWFEGSTGAHQGRKGGAGWDGGYLVPMIAWMPAALSPRVTSAIGMNIDLLPTIARLAGVPAPRGVTLDGRDLWGVWRNGAATPHDQLLLFNNERVAALRTQHWKLVGRSYYRSYNLPLASLGYPLLFDIGRDPGETINLASRHPDVLADLTTRYAAARAAFEPLGKHQIPDNIPSASST
ncbi:MAG: sulfatase-like hydrolase/transferase [Sphingomonas bacterium]|nr:sulfatase-like hydrolase/transferase [Sphingomonas bacterium]